MTMTTPPPTPPADGTTEPAATPPQDARAPVRWQFGVTIVLLIVFHLIALWLILNASVPDTVWKNQMAVFASIEAVVFTAVGWLFGREVHREQAQTARADAVTAQGKADAQAAEAAAAKEGEAAAKQKVTDLSDAVDTAAEAAGAEAGAAPPAGGGMGGQVSATPGAAPGLAAAASHLRALQALAGRIRDR